MFDIWNEKKPLAQQIYKNDNYKIIENSDCDGNDCVLFFSSHNVWFPNTEESFRYSFVENDYYEWLKFSKIKAKKVIYFRDIFKQWYVTGINEEINSIDKMISFMKEQTMGMKIITVGSSAGGYAAALFAAVLNAERCICFSGQFTLIEGMEKSPLIKKYNDNQECSKWYELKSYIEKSKTTVYYITPAYCKVDVLQYNYIKGTDNVKCLRTASKHHGVAVLKGNLFTLLSMNNSQLDALFDAYSNKIAGKIRLSVSLCGFLKTLRCLAYEVKRLINTILRRSKK